MIVVQKLRSESWRRTESVVAYNNADGSVLHAPSLSGDRRAIWENHGYPGSREIVCIDCKDHGVDVPVELVEPKERITHFRHQKGLAPDGTGQHGETSQHIVGKMLIASWARDQPVIVTESVEEERWVPRISLRSDVHATLRTGGHVALEVQRKPINDFDWNRRHGKYGAEKIVDTWLWAPIAGLPRVGPPTASLIFDVDEMTLGVLVSKYGDVYRHPLSQPYFLPPTHYVAAEMSEWTMSRTGWFRAPEEMAEFIGTPYVPDATRSGPSPLASGEAWGGRTTPDAAGAAVRRERPRLNIPQRAETASRTSDSPAHTRLPEKQEGDAKKAEKPLSTDPVVRTRQIIARRAEADEYSSIKRSLERLSRISPGLYHNIGRRFEEGDDREVLLWVDALWKRERQGSDDEFVEYIRTQTAVIGMIMALTAGASGSDGAERNRVADLRGVVVKTIAKSWVPMTVPRARAITYAVWAYGTGKNSWLVEANEKSAIDFIEENLPRLVELRAQVAATRDPSRSFQQTIELLRTLVESSRG